MLSRALSLATVTLLMGCFAAVPVRAQNQNLEAGKSPSQIFAGTCTACHKSPRGLLKTVSAAALPGFLREHYTTSSDMASLLSSYLVSNGATDTRGSQSKPGTEPKSETRSSDAKSEQPDRPGRRVRPGAQEAAKPDTDGSAPQVEPGRQGRKRLARPVEGSDEAKPAADGQAPVQAGDDRKLSAKPRLSKRGKPGGEESPKADTAKSDAARIDAGKDESPKAEPAKDDKPKSDTAREESSKPEGAKPASEGKPETAKSEASKSEASKPDTAKIEAPKIEAPKDNSGAAPVLRADPVPPVTPAPPASAATSPAASSGAPEQPAARPSAPPAPPPAVTASAPPPAPAGSAGPPAPPISQ